MNEKEASYGENILLSIGPQWQMIIFKSWVKHFNLPSNEYSTLSFKTKETVCTAQLVSFT
mgnify:CR=1 FL=1